jgi:hypothetical protein
MSDWIAMITALANVALFTLVAVINLLLLRRTKDGVRRWRWAYVILAMYWAGLYLFFALADLTPEQNGTLGPIFVRPALTLTAGLMAAMSLYRLRSGD